MKNKQTPSTIIDRMGKLMANNGTVVFVAGFELAMKVEALCASLGLACASGRWLKPASAIDAYTRIPVGDGKVLVAIYPWMVTGYHVPADRVVWVGPVPRNQGSYEWTLYEQANSRAESTTGEEVIRFNVPAEAFS